MFAFDILKSAGVASRFRKPRTNAIRKPQDRLNLEQLAFWNRTGCLVVEDALGLKKAAELVTEVLDTARKFFDEQDPSRVCHRAEADNTFVKPNGRLIAAMADGQEPSLQPLQRIRRIGTGVHRHLPAFRSVTFSASNQQILRSLGYQDPRVTQSLIITKALEVSPRVVPHQDRCSNFTDPPSNVTFWCALQDATADNGCLTVAPGSHIVEPIARRCRAGDRGLPQFTPVANPRYAKIAGSGELVEQKRNADGGYEFKPLEVKAGTLILMHGNLADNYLQPYDGETEFEKLEPKS